LKQDTFTGEATLHKVLLCHLYLLLLQWIPHPPPAFWGRAVLYDCLIDTLTVQLFKVVLEMIGWSFSSPAHSTDY